MKVSELLQSIEVAYEEEEKVLKYIEKQSWCRIISVSIFTKKCLFLLTQVFNHWQITIKQPSLGFYRVFS